MKETKASPAELGKPHYNIPKRDSANIKQALAILRGGQGEPNELLELAKNLIAETRFGYARRLLTRAITHESIGKDKKLRLEIFQKLALAMYKDQDLPADDRLQRGLFVLEQVEDLAATKNQETLGLLGSIYKRKWEVDSQRHNLERSLEYYLRGYAEGVENDQGYTGINAAFVLDQLASLEGGSANKDTTAADRSGLAIEIRQEIITKVGSQIDAPGQEWLAGKWWYYATIAEAYFGLKNYKEAVKWIQDGKKAVKDGIFEWELESCARQLAALAAMQDVRQRNAEEFEGSGPWKALEEAFGSNAVPRTAFLGKIGLAMSGGGFRASLYHLGVLAQLAELDVLRQVEVLSCVSGGSIVGAHYYLMVRDLLQTKPEEDITREDYIALVAEMIDEFLAGVQQNVRVSIALNPFKTFSMIWNGKYSRTTRAGELYEKYLYSRVKDNNGQKPRWLNDLIISPMTRNPDGTTSNDKDFSPKYENWRRDAKVPILVINAATLNTGHTWQFTASWMGEAPSSIDSEVDGNERLRRMYYSEAPEEYQKIRLGTAVGASAAVPGVFEPISFDKLYPERIIRLVDGGVCDNQGVGSLLEQDCKVMLVSDASGQKISQAASSRSLIKVLLRTNSVFQARIREAQYHDLKGRRRSSLLSGFMFVHLKGDLDVDPVDWIDCLDPYSSSDDSRPPARRGTLTRYGVSKKIQELLSGIRTDLDSFSDAEAYALMTSGYRMTEFQFKHGKCVEGFPSPPRSEPWKFLQIEECMIGGGPGFKYVEKLLTAGDNLAFKVWKIDPVLNRSIKIAVLVLTALFILLIYSSWNEPLPSPIVNGVNWALGAAAPITKTLADLTVGQLVLGLFSLLWTLFGALVAIFVLSFVAGEQLSRNIVQAVRWKDFVRRIALALILSTVGLIISVVHLFIFDKRFLSLGSIETVKRRNKKNR